METLLESSVNTEASRNIYCLFCKSGREESVAAELEKHGIACLIAYANRIAVRNGVEVREKRKLLPGYVFLETGALLLPGMAFFQSNSDTLKLLSYDYNEYTLRNDDLTFYYWLKKRDGVIDVSQVYRIGDRIKVVSGPLKEYEGRIVEVNKKRKCVAISLGKNSLTSKIWCSIEYIEMETE